MIQTKHEQLPSGFNLQHTLTGHTTPILSTAWSPDGRLLASASADHAIRLWDVSSASLLYTLTGHTGAVANVSWSPDGRLLASASADHTIRLWNISSASLLYTLSGHTGIVYSVSWSPNGRLLVSASADKTIRLWNIISASPLHTLIGHTDAVYSVAWSSNQRLLASASYDKTVRLWDAASSSPLLHTFTGHTASVWSVTWSSNGHVFASASEDQTVCIWNAETRRLLRTLEGHTNTVSCVSFSTNHGLLASKSFDGTVRLWDGDTGERLAVLHESSSGHAARSLAFHPELPLLATLGQQDKIIRIWHLDLESLHRAALSTSTVHYTNAKVVLVGDSGVGKSGLGLVLSHQHFIPTESTHGRYVWTFDSREVKLDGVRKETRETLLWDLAGQPGYRLVHQLHLNEVAVAMVVFDAHSETDPFAGVLHWMRALRVAQSKQESTPFPMKKFLVAARMDRGGTGVSRTRIDELVGELGFDGYFETSAKEGRGTTALREAITGAVDWEGLPKVSSTRLFQRIKGFLVAEKKAGRLLSTVEDLYHIFLKDKSALTETEKIENVQAQFETCIGRVESQGLIRRLSFGNFVLLQPELLDAYASALVNAVKEEPDGLGGIAEERVLRCDFTMPAGERIQQKEKEKVLLIAMVEDLLRYEVALREQADDGPYLIFPSQSTRTNPALPDPEGKTVVFRFEGPVQHIYATLAVRLSHSGLFQLKKLWKNAVEYAASVGGICGMFLQNIDEGYGELTLFFDTRANEQTRLQFEQYAQLHLQRRALPESIKRQRLFVCSNCGYLIPESLIVRRLRRGLDWINCPDCEQQHISLLDREERLTAVVQAIDRAADKQRDLATAQSVLQGKRETSDFNVFLCHNVEDKAAVKQIGAQLKERGILPWLDEWELRPGLPWQRILGEQIGQIKSAAVFVGKSGVGPWQQIELEAFLHEFVERKCPVIPVLLPDAPQQPQLPIFLKGMTWVDFRKQDPDLMDRLIWGITGERYMM